MITTYEVAKFLNDTLSDSIEFNDFVTAEIESEMVYMLYQDMSRIPNGVNFPDNHISIATYENLDEAGKYKGFKTFLLITIQRYDTTATGNKWVEPTFEKLDSIALKAKEVIKKELGLHGINGNMEQNIEEFNMFTPAPNGENGLQMQIDIRMSKDLLIC